MEDVKDTMVEIPVVIKHSVAQKLYGDEYRFKIEAHIHRSVVSVLDECNLGTLMEFEIKPTEDGENYNRVRIEFSFNLDRALEIWGGDDKRPGELLNLYHKRIHGAVDEALRACGVGGVLRDSGPFEPLIPAVEDSEEDVEPEEQVMGSEPEDRGELEESSERQNTLNVEIDMDGPQLAIASLLEDLADDVYEGRIESKYRIRKDSDPILRVSFDQVDDRKQT